MIKLSFIALALMCSSFCYAQSGVRGGADETVMMNYFIRHGFRFCSPGSSLQHLCNPMMKLKFQSSCSEVPEYCAEVLGVSVDYVIEVLQLLSK